MRRLLFFAAMCLMALSMSAQDDYIDLGLPSGTLWKRTAEQGYYTYEEALSKFQDHLPTKEQFEELMNECTWTWTPFGYDVLGPSGETISLLAPGFRHCNSTIKEVGMGYYWSSTPFDEEYAWFLDCTPGGVQMNFNSRCIGGSVCLVR